MILTYRYINNDDKISRAEIRKRQSESAIKLLFELLKDCGIEERTVARDKNGRPFLVGRDDVDFNISHSGQLIVCALSVGEGRVGVDVEKSGTDLPPAHRERFLKRFFAQTEMSEKSDLAKMWTENEAYLKYLGVGISEGIRPSDPYSDERVKIDNFYIGNYTVSVCTEKGASVKLIPKTEPQAAEE